MQLIYEITKFAAIIHHKTFLFMKQKISFLKMAILVLAMMCSLGAGAQEAYA